MQYRIIKKWKYYYPQYKETYVPFFDKYNPEKHYYYTNFTKYYFWLFIYDVRFGTKEKAKQYIIDIAKKEPEEIVDIFNI